MSSPEVDPGHGAGRAVGHDTGVGQPRRAGSVHKKGDGAEAPSPPGPAHAEKDYWFFSMPRMTAL